MRKLIFFLLILIPGTCVGQGEWNTVQTFNEGLVAEDSARIEGFARVIDSLISEGLAKFEGDLVFSSGDTLNYITVNGTDTVMSINGTEIPFGGSTDMAFKLNISDTAAMLAPYALLVEAILPADTAAMLLPYALLVEAILPADTAAMLLPYALLVEAILPADTAAMLTPYALLVEAILPADTAAMLSTYVNLSLIHI